jgi:hypothetical protein
MQRWLLLIGLVVAACGAMSSGRGSDGLAASERMVSASIVLKCWDRDSN